MDGVIATPQSDYEVNKDCEKHLGKILDETGAELVISSSWRYETVEKTKEHFAEKGFAFCDKIVGVTIRAYQFIEKGTPMGIPRGVEIKHWIDNYIHRENAQGEFKKKQIGVDYSYVILDDDSDMLLSQSKHFIQCNGLIGLTEHQALLAIAILTEDEETSG